jgi:hypothetical protein
MQGKLVSGIVGNVCQVEGDFMNESRDLLEGVERVEKGLKLCAWTLFCKFLDCIAQAILPLNINATYRPTFNDNLIGKKPFIHFLSIYLTPEFGSGQVKRPPSQTASTNSPPPHT